MGSFSRRPINGNDQGRNYRPLWLSLNIFHVLPKGVWSWWIRARHCCSPEGGGQCAFALPEQVGDKVSFLSESFPVFHWWVFLESSESRVLLFYSCFDVLVYKRVFLFYCSDNLWRNELRHNWEECFIPCWQGRVNIRVVNGIPIRIGKSIVQFSYIGLFIVPNSFWKAPDWSTRIDIKMTRNTEVVGWAKRRESGQLWDKVGSSCKDEVQERSKATVRLEVSWWFDTLVKTHLKKQWFQNPSRCVVFIRWEPGGALCIKISND